MIAKRVELNRGCCLGDESKVDLINHPPHYTHGTIEPIDVIEDWQLGYHLGAAVKYIARHKHKGTPLQDLKKASWYLNRLIGKMEREQHTK